MAVMPTTFNPTEALKKLKAHASRNGFELLNKVWEGANTKHQFLHTDSGVVHAWAPAQIMGRRSFPKDLRNDADRLLELAKYAKEHGFELLEQQWLGATGVHRFVHTASGKDYSCTPHSLTRRNSFPKDLRSDSDRLSALSKYASTQGFVLLDTTWRGVDAKYRFKHIQSRARYEGVPSIIMGKQGFPKDLRTPQQAAAERLEVLRKHAQANSFELLETQWQGADKKYRFKHTSSGQAKS